MSSDWFANTHPSLVYCRAEDHPSHSQALACTYRGQPANIMPLPTFEISLARLTLVIHQHIAQFESILAVLHLVSISLTDLACGGALHGAMAGVALQTQHTRRCGPLVEVLADRTMTCVSE